ncbi:MAG: serine protease [Nitrospira sp.]|nr:serine protease [Nitrospira sp.]MDH4357710.1 serine protease [Nitrospira sp.]
MLSVSFPRKTMHVLCRVILVVLLALISSSGGASAATLEDLSVAVAYLREGDQFGTGFFVSSTAPYLVTASHVAAFLKAGSKITFRAKGDTPVSVSLTELTAGVSQLQWQLHPEADVAVLRLTLTAQTAPLMQGRFLGLEMIDSAETAPVRERTVTVMGFPLRLGTTGRFSPITSDGKPASGLLRILRADNKKEATFFLLDKPSIGGFSGGPVYLLSAPYASGGALVFTDVSAPPKVVGLVHGTISDNTGGKLAAIVPSRFIHETIASADKIPVTQK